jgi:hypothetical protein
MAQLAQADMTPADKQAYKKRLDDGFALHERGRESQDRSLMKEAVKILDDIKADIEK